MTFVWMANTFGLDACFRLRFSVIISVNFKGSREIHIKRGLNLKIWNRQYCNWYEKISHCYNGEKGKEIRILSIKNWNLVSFFWCTFTFRLFYMYISQKIRLV